MYYDHAVVPYRVTTADGTPAVECSVCGTGVFKYGDMVRHLDETFCRSVFPLPGEAAAFRRAVRAATEALTELDLHRDITDEDRAVGVVEAIYADGLLRRNRAPAHAARVRQQSQRRRRAVATA
jgi:hypothetical protein